jgi:hypothetical protein
MTATISPMLPPKVREAGRNFLQTAEHQRIKTSSYMSIVLL